MEKNRIATFIIICRIIYEPRRTRRDLRIYADSVAADRTTHLCSLQRELHCPLIDQ